MSPRSADPALRSRLIDTAARLLTEEGPAALTSRRLAAEVGTSTMAVFSRFATMTEVWQAVRAEGFARLESRLDALPVTDDPVADLVAAGTVFFEVGVSSPHLYRAMMIDRPPEADDLGVGTYERLVTLIRRCIAAGRFPEATEALVPVWAAQMWTMRHGMVAMAVAGLLPVEQARFVLEDMTYRLLIGYGDKPARARHSLSSGSTTGSPSRPSSRSPSRPSSRSTSRSPSRLSSGSTSRLSSRSSSGSTSRPSSGSSSRETPSSLREAP